MYGERKDKMTNILKAILNIINNPINDVKKFYGERNRATNMGKALEEYIKDMFSGAKDFTDESKRLEELEKTFSFLGNANNPPDMMIRGGNLGDAIEVKKIEGKGRSAIALNSSYPKEKLYAASQMITSDCKECETWSERDIIYCIGVVNKTRINKLTLVYGTDYAAKTEIYERIRTTLKDGIESIPGVEFVATKELGKIKKVDPLGITDLRIRGMWSIDNPLSVFSYIHTPSTSAKFELVCIINIEKYNSFPEADRAALEDVNVTNGTFEISNIKIKSPNNPANLKDGKLIKYARTR